MQVFSKVRVEWEGWPDCDTWEDIKSFKQDAETMYESFIKARMRYGNGKHPLDPKTQCTCSNEDCVKKRALVKRNRGRPPKKRKVKAPPPKPSAESEEYEIDDSDGETPPKIDAEEVSDASADGDFEYIDDTSKEDYAYSIKSNLQPDDDSEIEIIYSQPTESKSKRAEDSEEDALSRRRSGSYYQHVKSEAKRRYRKEKVARKRRSAVHRRKSKPPSDSDVVDLTGL